MTFKENKPIYLQIADRIMDEILQEVYEEEGTYPVGTRICRNSGGECEYGSSYV